MSATPPQGTLRRVRVREVRETTRSVASVVLDLPGGETVPFQPGQFVRLRFPGEAEWRDYSLCTAPPARGSFRVAIAKAGRFTERLFALAPGAPLEAEGPMGSWFYRDEGRPVVLVGGGAGITPLKAIAEHLLGQGLPTPTSLFYSARTPADILFREDLATFPAKGVPVTVTVTRPQDVPSGERWDGPVGRLSASLIQEKTPAFGESVFYLCGPASLVTGLRDALLAKGVPRERLRYDPWIDA